MIDSLVDPAQWAQIQFGLAQLGDKRRNKRLVNIAQHLASNPGGTLPKALPDRAELKAAYRFFGQRGVTFDQVLDPHVQKTRDACRQAGEYLLIEDTTCLDYSSHRATENLGVIGDGGGRGFDLHSTLAVRIEAWTAEQRPQGRVVGLFDQQCRTPRPAPKGETRSQLLRRPRKSQLWASAFKTAGCAPQGCQWVYVADRESDCYEPLQLCQQHKVDFVVRSCQNRILDQKAGYLDEALAKAPVLGRSTIELRARPGVPARTAIVEIRSTRVDLKGPYRPGGSQPALKDIGVIEVTEVELPQTVKEPLHWVLLTSLPCATFEESKRVVGRYTARWWIEEYHKALKSGVGVEDSQLGRADRLEVLIAVLAVVALRLLGTKMLARSRPDSYEAAESFGPEMLTVLEKKLGLLNPQWTNQNVIIAIARLGGFLARKHDGMPGWQTIWRGWQRLIWMCQGAELIHL